MNSTCKMFSPTRCFHLIHLNREEYVILKFQFSQFMAYYHVHGLIPDTLAQSEGYQLFEQYIANGAPKDNFDGFELISRVHAPQTGEVFVTCKAENHLKVAEHFAIWRAKFGVEWDVKPVFNDEEVIKRNKQVAEEIAAMG